MVQLYREIWEWQDNKVLIITQLFRAVNGIPYFLKALSTVIGEMPEMRVILVGQGPIDAKLRALVNQLGLAKYVYFARRILLEEIS